MRRKRLAGAAGSGDTTARTGRRRGAALAALGSLASVMLGPLALAAAAGPVEPQGRGDRPRLDPPAQVTEPGPSGGVVAAAFDGTNHLVVWSETEPQRNVPRVAGSLVAPDGTPIGVTGISISDGEVTEYAPSVAYDGTNYLVVYQQVESVYGVRVDRRGAVLEPPFPISPAGEIGYTPRVVFDGTNHLVSWISGGGRRVVAARVSPSALVRDPAGITVASGDQIRNLHGVASLGGRTLIVWTDTAAGGRVVAARVDASGAVLDPSGIVVSTVGSEFATPSVTAAGANFMVVWDAPDASGEGDVYGSRVSPEGAVLDGNGFVVHDGPRWQQTPVVGFDGTLVVVTWVEYDFVWPPVIDLDTHGTRMTVDGEVLDPAGYPLVTAGDIAMPVALVPDGAGGLLFLWTGGQAMRLVGGRPPPDPPGKLIPRAPVSGRSDVAFDGTNYLVAWSDRTPDFQHRTVYAIRVSPSGERLDPEPILLSTGGSTSYQKPAVSFDGVNFLVVWSEPVEFGEDLRATRVSPGGAVLDPDGIVVTSVLGYEIDPAVDFDGSNHLVVFTDLRTGSPDLWAVRVAPDGTVRDEQFVAGAVSPGDADVASDGRGSLVVWSDSRSGDADVHGTRIGRTGGPEPAGGFPISEAPGDQTQPSVAWNGQRHLVVWTDQRSGDGADVYGARVTRSNRVRDPDGLAIATAPGDQYDPAIAAGGARFVVAWTDRLAVTEDRDVHGARVRNSGLVRNRDRFAIAAGPRPEDWPALTGGPRSDVGVAWSLHRSNSPGLVEDGVVFMREVSPK